MGPAVEKPVRLLIMRWNYMEKQWLGGYRSWLWISIVSMEHIMDPPGNKPLA